jgi:CRP/FNR family cyclic AMP-dependent transcriptional regulator
MPAVTDSSTLRNLALFAGLADEQLDTINRRIRKHNYASGTYVITAETPGEAVYIILSGTVKIKVDQADGKEVIIAILGAGAIVGEISVLDSAARSADVMTQEDSTLLLMDRATFNELLDSIPTISRNLLQILSRRLRLSTEQIQALCTLDVFGMVARQLIAFADLYGEETGEGVRIPLRLTQSDIAGIVGASRERVNQVFVSLRDSKLITVDNNYRITILNDAKLREIVRQR